MQGKDLMLRFMIGGAAVALSYIVSALVPWRLLAGVFATFPAVMIAAVSVVGMSSGSKKASEIAKGSVYGMLGCSACVLTVHEMLTATGIWWASVAAGLIAWFVSSALLLYIRERLSGLGRARTELARKRFLIGFLSEKIHK